MQPERRHGIESFLKAGTGLNAAVTKAKCLRSQEQTRLCDIGEPMSDRPNPSSGSSPPSDQPFLGARARKSQHESDTVRSFHRLTLAPAKIMLLSILRHVFLADLCHGKSC